MNGLGRASLLLKMPNVEFFYDIRCPWSYIASKRIEQVVQRANATVKWVPVRLSGIYEATNATKLSVIGKARYDKSPSRKFGF